MKAKVSLCQDFGKSTKEKPLPYPKHGKFQPLTWSFRGRQPNPDYQSGLVRLSEVRPPKIVHPDTDPLRACLKHHNAEIFRGDVLIKTAPKWATQLNCTGYDPETGEMIDVVYSTDDLRASNNRKIKALNQFCDVYQPLYKSHDVSLLLHTFTQADYAYLPMRRMLDTIKYRYRLLEREIRGYVWVLEISKPEHDKIGFHPHYHLVIACDRINVKGKGIPDELKLDDVWGQQTNVEFVKKNIRSYLGSYMGKNNWRMTTHSGDTFRMCGKSRTFK